MSNNDPTRRVLDEFGADDSIEGVDTDLRAADVAFVLGTAFLGAMVYELVSSFGSGLPSTVGFALAVVLTLAAVVAVFATPDSESSTPSWLQQRLAFWRQEKERSVVDVDPQNRTTTLTHVKSFHTDDNAIERVDGALVGGVRVEPANLSLASDRQWHQAASQFGTALNGLDYAVQFYTAGRHADAEKIASAYDGREHDEDIAGNETLEDLVEMYQGHYRSEFNSIYASQITLREYYILIPVREDEVTVGKSGVVAALGAVPIFGDALATVLGAVSEGDETKIEQRRELASRIEDVESAIQNVQGCSTNVLSTDDLAGMVEESWTGVRSNQGSRVRSVPVVLGPESHDE